MLRSVSFALAALAVVSDSLVAQTNTFPGSGNAGIGTSSPSELLSLGGSQGLNVNLGSYAHLGTDYSAWSTVLGNNVRARHGQVSGLELASGYVGSGGAAIRLVWDTVEFHVASAAEISGYSQGSPFAFPRAVIKASGNLGIGNTAPDYRLDVFGPAANYPARVATPDGFLLFGPANNSWCHFATNSPRFYFSTGVSVDSGNIGSYDEDLSLQTSGATRVTVANSSGNVGIGTTAPTHKLSVAGTIKAKEVIVETTGWSDYVFADDYRLAPLSEIEAHIKAEKRLPGIPSEQQVAEQGVSVGEMQAALLAKIEELTLHQIEQEKLLRSALGRIANLETENAALRSQPRP